MSRGACWAAVHGVAQSWTRLKHLSMSSIVSVVVGFGFWFCFVFIKHSAFLQEHVKKRRVGKWSFSRASALFLEEGIWAQQCPEGLFKCMLSYLSLASLQVSETDENMDVYPPSNILSILSISFLKIVLIYFLNFWLCWVFIAAQALL